MNTFITILTVLNSLTLVYILLRGRFSYHVHKTFSGKILSYYFYFNSKFIFHLPIRNSKKVEIKENIDIMLRESYQNRRQRLNAIFSWLNDINHVLEFQKNYSVVDKQIVDKLVDDFKLKNNIK